MHVILTSQFSFRKNINYMSTNVRFFLAEQNSYL